MSHVSEMAVSQRREELQSFTPSPRRLQERPAPSASNIFRTMLKKHVHVAFKRRRLLTSLWPAIMYSVISIVLFHIFAEIDSGEIRALLLALTIPLYMVLAVQSALQNAMAEIVTEKESKMKIVQEIYGLTATMYWLSWGTYFFLVSSLCVLTIYILLAWVAPVMAQSSPAIVICLLLVSYLQQLEFAAIASVFFNKLQTATAMSGFINLLCLLLAEAMQAWLLGQSKLLWYLASLLPTVNLFNGFAAIMFSEALYYCDDTGCYQGISMKTAFVSELCMVPYDNVHGSPCPPGAEKHIFSAGESAIMIFLDIILYGFLAWWLEQVWQGDFGQAKPWFFCLDPAYMCPQRRHHLPDAGRSLVQEDGLQEVRPLAMKIRNLRKVFQQKVAVDGMDLDINEGEIFALLGHNGAGKTTCINCVVGLIPMTSGEATVCGHDVRTELESVRRNISVCPQDNPLYDVFTVRQHLMFFASLRGVNEQVQETRVMEVLRALGIEEKVDQQCTTLSGGQKRRLWVATALLGDIPVVFLDEPTSGMDPSSRQQLWKLLLDMKSSGRSIIFTTHYLEEADVLADRKAVLARGRVEACGTSLDLKLKFGLGYQLQLQLKRSTGLAMDQQVVSDVFDVILKHIPLATRKEEDPNAVGADMENVVAFTLPFDQVDKFGPMLIELDTKKEALGILTYSISMTTLEEVFMGLGEKAEREAANSGRGQGENTDFREVEQEADLEHGEVYGPDADERRSAKAMMRVRLRLATANRSAIFSVWVLPTMLNLVAVFTEGSKSTSSQGQSAAGQSVGLAIYPPMAFGISIVAFTLQLVREKEVKTKHVALAQGLPVRSFWLGTAMAHYLVTVLNSLILVVAILVQGDEKLTGSGFPILFVEAFIYPVSLLLMAYNFSMLFTQVEFASKVLPLTNLLLGIVPVSAIYILLQTPQLEQGAEIAHVVMSVTNPVYGLPGVIVMMMSKTETSLLSHVMSSTASPLYGSIILCIVLTTNLIYQDARSRTAVPGNLQDSDDYKDDDVRKEEDRVERSLAHATFDGGADQSRQGAVIYHRLHHTYRTRGCSCWRRRAPVETAAVRGISLGIKSGECFGLLGPNGAGKTTTLAVLTGEVRPPTAGQVHILGHDITTTDGIAEAYKYLGVCPQVDPLWENLTGREHLMFFGRIKGVPEANLPRKVDDLLYRLGLSSEDSNRKSTEYSGGMKRKLSLAIALIGRSPLLFLDEPSAALDAGAKRHLWKVLKRRGREQTVVVTTHSMEEAEALCDRIAIQVRGQLRCLGPCSHIKKEYGSGCQLEIFCEDFRGAEAERKAQELQHFVENLAPGSGSTLEHHVGTGRFLFQLPKDSSLGTIFLEVEKNKSSLHISYYFINQPSLEQVFVRFAREQEEL